MSDSPGTAARMREENAVLRDVVTIYSELSGLASQDTEIAAVLRLVTDRVRVAAAVVDAELQVIAIAELGASDSLAARIEADRNALRRLVSTAAKTRRALSVPAATEDSPSTVIAPIILGNEPAAYLLTFSSEVDGPSEDMRLMVTEHAATICAIVLGRARVVAAAAGQARRDLFEGLLLPRDRDDAEVDNWARHLGIKPDQPHRAVTVVLDGPEDGTTPGTAPSRVAAFAEHQMLAHYRDASVVIRGEEVVAVLPSSEPGPASLADLVTRTNACKTAVETRFPSCTVSAGIGNCYSGAARISRSYAEARHAVDTTRLMSGLGGVAVFAELGIHRLLAQVKDIDDLRSFAADVLGELLDHERTSSTDHLTTLTVYFNENSSPQRTARRLHLHPNTVAYRVRRIEEITGLSLNSYSDRLVMQVALEIVNGLGESR